MENPIDSYWKIKLNEVKEALTDNNFEAYVVEGADEARTLVLDKIIPSIEANSMSWGGSLTFKETGLYEALKGRDDMEVIDTYDKSIPPEDRLDMRRKALLAELFFTGSNAVTETGLLVNLDMIGNRVAALTFGPRHVIVLAGRNKIVPELQDAFIRIKNYASPVNAARLDKQTPCVETASCEECRSNDRICNTWTITEKSFPKGRIKVALVNADMGF